MTDSGQAPVSNLEWRKSPAHLALLAKFLHPERIDGFGDYLDKSLGENVQYAIGRFLSEGVISSAPLSEVLAYKFRLTDLKLMSKQRGLRTTGKKQELIIRLVEADAEGLRAATAEANLYQCSENGHIIADQYLRQEEERRLKAEETTYAALKEGKLNAAIEIASAYETQKAFRGGVGTDLDMLEGIFQNKPKILTGLTDDQLRDLRIAAGMIYIWQDEDRLRAKGVLPSFDTALRITNDVAARMLIFHAYHLRRMNEYLSMSHYVKKIKMSSVDDERTCAACRKLRNKKFSLENVPELPFEGCSSEDGCRCIITAITLDDM